MPNENCLKGVKCPRCGNEDRFLIVVTILADVTDDGADTASNSEWDWNDASHTHCPECGETSLLSHFRVDKGDAPEAIATVTDGSALETQPPIVIEVRGGVVQDVQNVPPGYEYEIKDYDNIEADEEAAAGRPV
jgi:ribosomal protein S27AE